MKFRKVSKMIAFLAIIVSLSTFFSCGGLLIEEPKIEDWDFYTTTSYNDGVLFTVDTSKVQGADEYVFYDNDKNEIARQTSPELFYPLEPASKINSVNIYVAVSNKKGITEKKWMYGSSELISGKDFFTYEQSACTKTSATLNFAIDQTKLNLYKPENISYTYIVLDSAKDVLVSTTDDSFECKDLQPAKKYYGYVSLKLSWKDFDGNQNTTKLITDESFGYYTAEFDALSSEKSDYKMSISRTSIYVTKYPKVTQEELCGGKLSDVRYFCELTEKDSDKTEIDESQDGKYDQFSFSDLKPNTEYNLAFYATNGYYNRDLITKKAHLTVTTKPEYVNPEKPTVTEIADAANPLKTKLKVEFGKHPADSEDSHLKYNIEYYPTNKVFKEKYKIKSFDYPQDGYCEFEVNGGNTYYVSIVVSDPDDDKYSVSSEFVTLKTNEIEDSFSGILLPQSCSYDTFTGTYTWGFVYGNQLGYYKFNLSATAFKEKPELLFMNYMTTSSFTPTTGLERKTVNLGHFDVKFATPDNSDTSTKLQYLSSIYYGKAPSDITDSYKNSIYANKIYNDSIYLHFYRAYSNLYSEELTEDYGAAICFIY